MPPRFQVKVRSHAAVPARAQRRCNISGGHKYLKWQKEARDLGVGVLLEDSGRTGLTLEGDI